MVKRHSWLCNLVPCIETRAPSAVSDSFISANYGIYSKEMKVRVIHAGGREEVYPNKIVVSKIMEKYPDMCLAKPEVFKLPYESVLASREVLLPGNKYFLIPSTTIKKLKRKYSEKMEEELSDTSACLDDFYDAKEKCFRNSPKKNFKKQSEPPTRRQSVRRSISNWEPSLMSIEETST